MTQISILDTNWTGRPRSIAAALLESQNHRVVIDPGPASTLPTLRERLRSRNLSVADLDAILLTHIHLDHAGASGALVRENPRLQVYVHSKGAPHVVDPSKLLASAGRLYGSALQDLYGDTSPVPQENLRILEGGETISLGADKLEVAYTPGHASHHVSYFDLSNGVAFVGDTAGIRFENGPYLLPAAPPPDINLELWDASFAEIRKRKPTRLLLTHFGFVEDPAAHLIEFREQLHRWKEMVDAILSLAPDEAAGIAEFETRIRSELADTLEDSREMEHYVFNGGLNLSFLGLARYLRKRTAA